jgi:hypothetical protein
VRKQILGAPFQVQHLEFLGLLDSAGAQVVIDADVADPAKQQHDNSYVQLKCSVDPSDFVHGAQDIACSPIQFCLQLPAHSRSSGGIISLLHSPAKKPSSVNSAAQPSALSRARQQLFAPTGFSTSARPPIPVVQGNVLTSPSVNRGSTTGTPAPGDITTEWVALHPSKHLLYAMTSSWSNDLATIVTYKVLEDGALERLGSTSTQG